MTADRQDASPPTPQSKLQTSGEETEGQGAGVGIMLVVTFLFSIMDALTKLVAQTYPAPQILWIRYMVFASVTLADGFRRRGRHVLRSSAPVLQICRGLMLAGEILMFIVAFRHLPLADIQSIAAAGPLIATALSVPLLKERVGIRRWSAVAVGAVGVLVIIRPGRADFDPLLLLPLVGISVYALYQVLTRIAARYDHPSTTTLYTGVTGLVALTFIGPFFWVPPDLEGLGLMLAIGVIGMTGHGLLIKALALAPASVLQPFNYLMIAWAVLFGWLFYGDLPDGPTIAGALIVVASGLYTLHRERVVRSRS